MQAGCLHLEVRSRSCSFRQWFAQFQLLYKPASTVPSKEITATHRDICCRHTRPLYVYSQFYAMPASTPICLGAKESRHEEKTSFAPPAKCTGKVSQSDAERPQSSHATYSDRAFDRKDTGRRQRPAVSNRPPDWRRLQKTRSGGVRSRRRTGSRTISEVPLGVDPLEMTLFSRLWSLVVNKIARQELHRRPQTSAER